MHGNKNLVTRTEREVKVGGFTFTDYTPGVFPSISEQFPYSTVQIGRNVEKLSHKDSIKLTKFDDLDSELTDRLRREQKRLGRFLPMSKLVQNPAYFHADGPSMILPRDNQVGLDWLTYNSKIWKEFIVDLCDRLVKHHPLSAVEPHVRILLTDYSLYVPYTSSIRKEGRMTVKYPESHIAIFRDTVGEFLKDQFFVNKIEDCIPRMNSTKSIGWPFQTADGLQVRNDQITYSPSSFRTLIEKGLIKKSAFEKKNTRKIKSDWMDSGRVDKAWEEILSDPDSLLDPTKVVQNFVHNLYETHTEAERTNNGDEFKNQFPNGSFSKLLGHLFHKDRDWCFECEPFVYKSGTYDQLKVTEFFHQIGRDLLDLRRRAIFPSNTACRDVGSIYLFHKIWHTLEKGEVGFPSLRPCVLERYYRFYDQVVPKYSNFRVLQFDRRTAEQFITDNYDTLCSLLPPSFGKLLKALSIAIVPSAYGPRFITGGLVSGGSPTTNNNSIFGLFELTNMFNFLETGRLEYPQNYRLVCEQFVQILARKKDFYEHKFFTSCLNLGTDDQYQPLCYSNDIVADRFNAYPFDERYLSGSFEAQNTGFGLHWTPLKVSVDPTLGLSKFFLQEKVLYGDACAAKMSKRLEYLGEYRDTIQGCMHDHKLGSLDSYEDGKRQFEIVLAEFGFPGAFLNEYHPVDRIMYGDLIDKYIASDVYKVTQFERLDNNFSKFLAS